MLFIFALASEISQDWCPLGCSNNGACIELFEKDAMRNDTLIPYYICECRHNYVGTGCQECKQHHFGKDCAPCFRLGDRVCGGHGLCDDGINGDGGCVCTENYTKASNCTEEYTFRSNWQTVTLGIALIMGAAILCIFMIYLVFKFPWLHFLPDSIASILLGMIVGFVYVSIDPNGNLTDAVFFDPQSFFLLLLPPIMYDAGYSSNKLEFFQNIGTILIFAIFGTMLATGVFGVLLYVVSVIISSPLTLNDCLLFGALISAVDPVATLAIFQAINVDSTLYMIVFGESVINDAVAIALFNVFGNYARYGYELDIGPTIGLFIYTFLGSIIVGVILGLVIALFFKVLNLSKYPTLETAMFFLCMYLPFVLCEAAEMSGILGVLFNGMVSAHYTHYSLSEESKITTHQTFRTLSFLAENICFVYLGLSLLLLRQNFVWPLIGFSSLIILFSRALTVFPLAALCNFFRQKHIPYKYQIVIWFSGLRGAVAIALALSTPSPRQDLIFSTTLVVVIASVILLGGSTKLLIKCLGIGSQEDVVLTRHGDSIHRVYSEQRDSIQNPPKSIEDRLIEFDKEYLQPFFRREVKPENLVNQ